MHTGYCNSGLEAMREETNWDKQSYIKADNKGKRTNNAVQSGLINHILFSIIFGLQ